MKRRSIRFLLNGETIEVHTTDPTRTLLQYVRETQRLTGTKEGCAEGDCGACTVVIGELVEDELRTRTVNACIQFLPTLDGKAVFTVEYLRRTTGDLHPCQQAMVDHHGSQCGFCTPGFVMSLWDQYNHHLEAGTRPSRHELTTSLSGNLCRCTGYRPILDAGAAMFELPEVRFDREMVAEALRQIQRQRSLSLSYRGYAYHAPRSLHELLVQRTENPNATLLAGCTDIGLWVNKQFRELGDIIYLGEVPELKVMEVQSDSLYIGAGVPLEDAYQTLCQHYPQLREMWERFASLPIRNAGTLGGNVANGSPIGDSMPWLIALGAQVHLISEQDARQLALEDFYQDYMKKDLRPDEIVMAIEIPLPQPNQVFRTYKVSKRFDSDISAVCAAFALTLENDIITSARVAFGGMAAIPKRAERCESVLINRPWTEERVRIAMRALQDDFQPLSDMRASAEYRTKTALNLLYRCYLETRSEQPLSAEQTNVFATAEVSA